MTTFASKKYTYCLISLAILSFSIIYPHLSYAAAQDESRFNIYLSAYRPSIDTSVRLDSDVSNVGTDIDLEDTTGLEDKKTLGALSLSYQISKKVWLESSYFELSRSGQRQLEADIEFGEEVFEIDETIDTRFNVDIARMGIGYAFYSASDFTLGLTGGFHITRFDIGIASESTGASEAIEETAPLPYVGLNINYLLSHKLSLGIHAEWFGVEVNDIDGSLTNADLALGYKFSRNFSVGLGYSYYQLKVSSEGFSDGLSGEIEYTYKGPLLFLRLGF